MSVRRVLLKVDSGRSELLSAALNKALVSIGSVLHRNWKHAN